VWLQLRQNRPWYFGGRVIAKLPLLNWGVGHFLEVLANNEEQPIGRMFERRTFVFDAGLTLPVLGKRSEGMQRL
jgi:hypothetical protein